MNQVQFETSKVFGVFVKIEDFKEMKRVGMNLAGNFRIQYKTTKDTVNTFTVDGIDENYKILGFVSELTDEQKEGIVDSFEVVEFLPALDSIVYYNYVNKMDNADFDASESFASLLTSLGINENDNWILLTCNK